MDSATLAKLMAANPMRELLDQSNQPSGQIITCPARVTYLAVHELQKSKKYPTRDPEASVSLVFPAGANLDPLTGAARRIARQHFGPVLDSTIDHVDVMTGDVRKVPIGRLAKWPLKSQLENKGKPGFTADGSGHWLRASSKYLPRVIDVRRNQIPNDSPELYAGMWVIALLRLYAYPKVPPTAFKTDTIFGCNVGLVQMQKIADDDRITTGGARDDAFGDLAALVGAGAPAVAASGASVPADGDIAW